MCSLILKPDSGKKKNIIFRKINEWLGVGSNKYVAAVTRTIKHPRRVLSAFGMVLIAILLIHRIIPTSFLPVEDQGYFKIELELPEGATLERTRIVTERAIAYLEKTGFVSYKGKYTYLKGKKKMIFNTYPLSIRNRENKLRAFQKAEEIQSRSLDESIKENKPDAIIPQETLLKDTE